MRIEDLFVKDVARPINGVVKADQNDPESVWQELDEYVVTRELDGHFRRFFEAYLATADRQRDADLTSRTGVWVSGFFGSGKSHFIKVVSYLLKNERLKLDGGERPIDVFAAKVADPLFVADLRRAVNGTAEVVLFNIDSKANKKESDPILSVFQRVFNEHLGYSGDHFHIARLERVLEERGKREAFEAAFEEVQGSSWRDERDAYDFHHDAMVEALSRALRQSQEASRKLVEDAERNTSLTPEGFAKTVREYLERMGPNHRILFLVDEVGQFIGDDTKLMLTLQTITENLGTACQGRAWVVVTSQENIENVIGEVKASKANDFSKIQGRFATRLSLSSSNTDEVIQARLLDKTDEAKAALAPVWQSKGDILRNQLAFRGNKKEFALPKTEADFVANYPFVPHQFQLIQRIFEQIRKHGATGLHLSRGERSMLEAFQDAAKRLAKEPVGVLVPLYRFYPSIESFLDTQVKRTIDQAKDDPVLQEFDVQLLRVLFLIRYVEEMRGNPDNLTTLCLDRIDADRIALRQTIEDSLQRLERQNLVSRNGDEYAFLTNEEQDVNREIKNVDLSPVEETKKLGDLIFGGVVREPFRHRHPVNKKDFGFNPFVDGAPARPPSAANDLEVRVVTPLADDYSLWDAAKATMGSTNCVLVKLGESRDLGRELRLFLQTDKYVRLKNDAGLPETVKRIISDRAAENRDRERRLIGMLETLMKEADYYVAGQSKRPEGASVATILGKQLDSLIDSLFSKLGYLKVLQENEEQCRREIVSVLKASSVGIQSLGLEVSSPNHLAYEEVRQYFRLSSDAHHKVVLKEFVARYERKPFGWPEWETVLVLARLIVLGEVQIVVDGAIVETSRAWDHLSKTQGWGKVQVVRRKVVDPADLQKARRIGNETLGKTGPDGEDALVAFLRLGLQEWQTELLQHKALAADGRYPGKEAIERSLRTIASLLAHKEGYGFIVEFLKAEDALIDLTEDYHAVNGFYSTQRPAWDRLLKAREDFGPNAAEFERDEAAAAAWARMGTILSAKEPYEMLKEVDALVSSVRSVNDARLEARRAEALRVIGARLEQTHTDVKALDDPIAENAIMKPLADLIKRAESERVVGNLTQAMVEAVDRAHEALGKVEARLRAKQAAEPSPKPYDSKAPAPKPTRRVQPSLLVKKVYLESEVDVREFVEALQTELSRAVAKGERVEIA